MEKKSISKQSEKAFGMPSINHTHTLSWLSKTNYISCLWMKMQYEPYKVTVEIILKVTNCHEIFNLKINQL